MNPMWIPAGISAAKGLFGTGGRVSVPKAMARPDDPTGKFVGDDGKLREQFQVGGLDNQMLSQGRGLLGNLKSRATMQGPTQQAQYLQQANQMQGQNMRDQMQKDMASQQATQASQLAMKGGLGSGARERMSQSMGNQAMMGGQNIGRQTAMMDQNILAQDEASKLGLLKSLPGQYQSFGNEMMRRQMQDQTGGIDLLMNKYDKDMQAYGANQMAMAQAQAANASNRGLLGGLFG